MTNISSHWRLRSFFNHLGLQIINYSNFDTSTAFISLDLGYMTAWLNQTIKKVNQDYKMTNLSSFFPLNSAVLRIMRATATLQLITGQRIRHREKWLAIILLAHGTCICSKLLPKWKTTRCNYFQRQYSLIINQDEYFTISCGCLILIRKVCKM